MAGSGFLSQHSKELLFGLGRSRRIVKVTITWPSGLVQTRHGRPRRPAGPGRGGQRRAESRAVPEGGERSLRPAVAAAGARRERAPAGVWLYEPFPAPDFTLRDLDGHEHSLAGPAGRPTLLPLLGDVGPALASGARGARRASGRRPSPPGGLDPRRGGRRPRRTRRRSGTPPGAWACRWRWPARRWPARTASSTATCSTAGRTCACPRCSCSAPRARSSSSIASRRPSAQIAEDVARIDAAPAERLARAVPFPGNSVLEPGQAQLLPVRAGALRAGLRRAGSRRLRARREGRPDRDHVLQPRHPLHEGRPLGRRPSAPSSAPSSCSPTTTSPRTAWERSSPRAATSRARSRASARRSRSTPTTRTRSTTSASLSSRPARRTRRSRSTRRP